MFMMQISVQDLRRVASTLHGLKGRQIAEMHMRSDMRQLKIEMSDGEMLVIGVESDETGRPHLEVDVVRHLDEPARNQLEVGFES